MQAYLCTKIGKLSCLFKCQMWYGPCTGIYIRVACQNAINILPDLLKNQGHIVDDIQLKNKGRQHIIDLITNHGNCKGIISISV